MTAEWVAVDITDDDDDISETITPEDWEAGERFARGVIAGLIGSAAFWSGVGVLVWAVWPR